MELRIEIPGSEINGLVRRIGAWQRRRRDNIERLVGRYTFMIERDAKRLGPVNKKIGLGGQLRSQIRSELEGLVGFVIAGANYSIFQELGTGRRGAASSVEGSVEGYEYGPSAGVAAQPFLVPAFKKHIGNFIRDLRAELGSV